MKRQQWHQRLIVGVLMFSAVPVVAAPPDRLSRNLFKNGAAIRTVFRPVVSGPSRTTVRVLVKERQRALGAIVGAEGWVVTKASELNGKISCRMKDGAVFPARLVSLHVDHDLALRHHPGFRIPAPRSRGAGRGLEPYPGVINLVSSVAPHAIRPGPPDRGSLNQSSAQVESMRLTRGLLRLTRWCGRPSRTRAPTAKITFKTWLSKGAAETRLPN